MSQVQHDEEVGALDVAEEVDVDQLGEEDEDWNEESDRSLQQRADKYNLSAINVRSIIHHVLKDDRVQSLLQQGPGSPSSHQEEGSGAATAATEISDILGPKLTRARVKKSLEEGHPMDPLSPLKMVLSRMPGTPLKHRLHSPAKSPPKVHLQRFVDMTFPDDDPFDDEYSPDKAEDQDSSGEEDEPSFRDTDVSSVASTPAAPDGDTALPIATATQLPTTDSLQDTGASPTEHIARQTRSKCPLKELSLAEIEATFQAPDTEPQQEDTPTDLDQEEMEWRTWLGELMRDFPSPAEGVDEDDGDYNFLADQQQEAEEVEEFRNDRAVRIPDEEVSDLIEELLSSYTAPQGTVEPASELFPPASGVLPLSSRQQTYLSSDQVTTVWTQIRKGFQLLMQSFVLTRFEPSLVFLAQIATKAVEEMCGLRDSGVGAGLWEIPFLDEGVSLIHSLNPYESIPVQSLLTGQARPPVSEVAAEVMFSNALFWAYPELLPRAGPAALSATSVGRTSPFTSAEDNLLVLGMQRFGHTAWKETCLHLLPTKTVPQLKNHVKNLCAVKRKWNIVKQLKKTGQLVLNPTEPDGKEDLPSWVQAMTEKHTRVQPPVFLAVRTTPGKRAIAPKTDKQGGPISTPSIKEQGGTASTPPPMVKGGAVSAPPPEDKGPECPAASTPLITTIMSALPEDQAQTIRGQLEQLGVTLRSSPRKGSNRPMGRAPPTPRQVARGRQVKHSGGPRQQGLPTSTVQMQPVAGGHAADGGNSPKQRQERQQMLAVLTGAGLETSDPTAQFLYCYITEVKAELSGAPKVYGAFLKALLQARELQWTAKQIYSCVADILKDWPHLVRIFADFLSPQEAADVNALQDKACTVWAKAFIAKLKNRFSSDPQTLQGILQALSTPELTREKVCKSVVPLLADHPDLVSDLRQCVAGAPPTSHQPGEVFEEIMWDGHTIPPPEECCEERTVLVQAASGSLMEVGREKGPSEGRATRKGGPHPQSHRSGKKTKAAACGDSNAPKRRRPQEEGSEQEKVAKLGESSKQASKSPLPALAEAGRAPLQCSKWSREEDRQVLEVSHGEGRRMDALSQVAQQLGRPTEEVYERYTFLLEQYHKAFLQQQT